MRGFLQNHKQSAGSDQDTADQRFRCKFLMQKQERQDQGNDYAQFVNGNDFGGLADLQRPVVAQPGCAGRQSGQNQEQPAFSADLRQPALRMGEENHSPCHDDNNYGSDSCREIGVDAFDADFRQDGSQRREYCGQ